MQTEKNITVEEYLLSWVDKHYEGNNIKASTHAGYKTTIKNQILPFIGKVKLKQLTSEMIDDMLKKVMNSGQTVPRDMHNAF